MGGPSAVADVSALFVVLIAAGPLLLPALGVELRDIAFAVPTAVLAVTTAVCAGAGRRAPARRRMWSCFAVASGLGCLASLAALASALGGFPLTGAFYLGFAASTALVAGAAQLGRMSWRGARPEQVLDAILLGWVIAAPGIYFVAVPGFLEGDWLLTLVFVVDLLALLLAAGAAQGSLGRELGTPMAIGLLAVSAGDALVAAAGGGQLGSAPEATAALWAVAGLLFASAAERERGQDAADHPDPEATRWPYLRALFPLPPILILAALGVLEVSLHGVSAWPITYFGAFVVMSLVLGFARQAYLVVANRRVAGLERSARADATRRNEELQAMTGLAATMTESLEEDDVVERGLEVVRLGARARSAALHVREGDALQLRAITGEWDRDRTWARPPAQGADPAVEERGGRCISRLPLAARGSDLGLVTLVRDAQEPYDEQELRLMRLLVAQLALAIGNARDYHERLEQAIRDPLTGVYNRRFFYEQLDKEMERNGRYGSAASLVIFDIDDFKAINDRHGHQAGDQVLCAVCRSVEELIRPVDSFARLGGEEFGLLLPETEQLDALRVAERIRSTVVRGELVPGIAVRVSAGVATCPLDGVTGHELEKAADDALYWAKHNGKNLTALASEARPADRAEADAHLVPHLHALVEMIDERLRTAAHSDNVATYAASIGQALGLDSEAILRLRRAALLHDVGKIMVRPEVLAKPEPLEPAERAEIERHPAAGEAILAQAGMRQESRWVRHHHERLDGEGYPDGLAGDQIPLESRILFVADALEAMTSDRPYRGGRSVERALSELRGCAGTQFDPRVVDAACRLARTGRLEMAPLRSAPASAAGRS